VEPDPDHPIITHPHRYDVVGFNYQLPDDGEPYIDLTLRRDAVIRRLRFFSPREIEIESGFPGCSGLQIKDVSANQLTGIRVRVTDFEPSLDAVRFWARDVIDLDSSA
jgi:hypothetical protein